MVLIYDTLQKANTLTGRENIFEIVTLMLLRRKALHPAKNKMAAGFNTGGHKMFGNAMIIICMVPVPV